MLLAHNGIYANLTCTDGSTALYIAAQNGHLEVVKALLAHPGLDANLTCTDRSTAVDAAVNSNHPHIKDCICQSGEDKAKRTSSLVRATMLNQYQMNVPLGVTKIIGDFACLTGNRRAHVQRQL